MFETTIWTVIRKAGDRDPASLEEFASRYRPAVLAFIRRKGFTETDAEDLCQDVFVRILSGDVLAKADAAKGRFRSLVLAVTVHVLQDRWRKKPDLPRTLEAVDHDPDFDRAWAIHLAGRAMDRMDAPYGAVLRAHVAGEAQDRNKVWIARRRLVALIREEIAFTCSSREEFEQEIAALGIYLRPEKFARQNGPSLDHRGEETP
jgi:DNA-directed RNA polymerase specialized sigma24 family protein